MKDRSMTKRKKIGIKGIKQMSGGSWVCTKCKNYARSEMKAKR
jgi:hypothetical protein